MMGSGGMIVMDEDDCMVAMAKFYLDFTVEESCGKCAPCRIGNKRLHEILQKITSGNGAEEDLTRLRNLAMVIKDTALCGLGQTSPNPVLSTMDNFYDEYLAHVREHRCPSHQCRELTQYFINPEKCKGCTLCARVCPVHAITGGRKIPHIIDPQACIRCGTCMEKCKVRSDLCPLNLFISMETIQLIIDNKEVEVPRGTTILDAAKSVGIHIPTLCYMKLEDLHYENNPGACRICVVEIEGRRNLAPSCKMECTEGMVVRTHTPRVMNARRTVMELILSNHPAECLTCSSNGHCELQKIAHDLGIREIRYKGEMSTFTIDRSPSIVRNMNKCIMCRRCETMCNTIQTVGALTAVNRGFNAAVSTAFERDMAGSTCSYCGQCVSVCPVNALSGRNTQQPVLDALADPTKIVIAQTAPAVRTALGRDFGYEPGTLVTGKMVSALRQLGFDYVFDTDFAADLTIMEEGTELLHRLGSYLNGDKEVKIPLMTSCCPGWVSFVEQHFPELRDNLSTAKSPQQMFGAIAKSYFAEKLGVDRKDLVVVSIMPCLAKKYELAARSLAWKVIPM